jgi:hypothetical protein
VNASLLPKPGWGVGITVGGCGVLLASIILGGVLNEGYSQTRDYVSALSGRGSTAAFVGILGLLGFSVAHAAAGLTFRRCSRVVFAALSLAAVSGVVVALARINCPGGAALCSVDDGADADGLDLVHGLGVGAYELCFVVGGLAGARWLLRNARNHAERLVGVTLAVLSVASVVLLTSTSDSHPGTVQRAWLLVNSATIIMLAVVVDARERSIRPDGYGVSSV